MAGRFRQLLALEESPVPSCQYRDFFFFFRYVRPLWKTGISVTGISVLLAGLYTLVPLSTKIFIDTIALQQTERLAGTGLLSGATALFSGSSGSQSLQSLVLALVIIAILIGTLELVRNYYLVKFREEYSFQLQIDLFNHVIYFPVHYFRSKQTGYLMSRISDDAGMIEYVFTNFAPQLLSHSFLLIFGFLILFHLNEKLTLLLLLFVPVFIIVNALFIKRIRAVTHREREQQACVSGDLQEILSGIDVIKTHTAEDREIHRYAKSLKSVVDTRIKNTLLSSCSSYIRLGTRFLMLMVVFWIGGLLVLNGGMSVGDFVAFATYIVLFSASVNTFFSFPVLLLPAMTAAERLLDIFALEPEHNSANGKGEGLVPETIHGAIEFRNVEFSYVPGTPVLTDISFTTRQGEIIGISGRTGEGKTTLMNLLLKFYTPQEGEILLDGNPVADLDPAWLRQQIAVVTQDIYLFHDTIEHNILYSRPDATREEVIEAARKAQIHDDISAFPDGYDTVVGERGAKLSTGQRQRIAIARAFLKDVPILFLDEPTSALDTDTEEKLRNVWIELVKNRTTFLVSHRKSLLGLADRLLVLENGRIIELNGDDSEAHLPE